MDIITSTYPPCDSWETSEHYVLAFDIPGLAPGDVRVSFSEGKITLTGLRPQPISELGKSHEHVECRHGAFSRTVPVPGLVDAAAISATYYEGVLQIVVPKLSASKAIAIPVKEMPHALAAPVAAGYDTEDEDADCCL